MKAGTAGVPDSYAAGSQAVRNVLLVVLSGCFLNGIVRAGMRCRALGIGATGSASVDPLRSAQRLCRCCAGMVRSVGRVGSAVRAKISDDVRWINIFVE